MTKLDELIAAIRALPENERQQVLEALKPKPVRSGPSPLVGLFADDPEQFEQAMKEGRTAFNQLLARP